MLMIIMVLILILFLLSNTNFYVPFVTLSAKDNQKLTKLLTKGFERSVYWNGYNKKENEDTTNEYRYFLQLNFVGVNRLLVLVYSDQRYKGIIYQKAIKNYNVKINGKNFYDQPIL